MATTAIPANATDQQIKAAVQAARSRQMDEENADALLLAVAQAKEMQEAWGEDWHHTSEGEPVAAFIHALALWWEEERPKTARDRALQAVHALPGWGKKTTAR